MHKAVRWGKTVFSTDQLHLGPLREGWYHFPAIGWCRRSTLCKIHDWIPQHELKLSWLYSFLPSLWLCQTAISNPFWSTHRVPALSIAHLTSVSSCAGVANLIISDLETVANVLQAEMPCGCRQQENIHSAVHTTQPQRHVRFSISSDWVILSLLFFMFQVVELFCFERFCLGFGKRLPLLWECWTQVSEKIRLVLSEFITSGYIPICHHCSSSYHFHLPGRCLRCTGGPKWDASECAIVEPY